MTKYYETVRAARNALCLDSGFDPFLSGGWGRCTKKRLAEAGYIVSRKEAAALARTPRCEVCQVEVKPEWTGLEYETPSTCPVHRKWSFVCDSGHRWSMTDMEAAAASHKCPRCGGYSV